MDELIQQVAQKTGLPPETAKKAADAVIGFLKDKLPAGISGQLEQFVNGGGDGAPAGLGEIGKKLGGLFGK